MSDLEEDGGEEDNASEDEEPQCLELKAVPDTKMKKVS